MAVPPPASPSAPAPEETEQRPADETAEPVTNEVEENAGPSQGSSELVRKRIVPPFWFDYETTTHRTRALTFPPLFVHRAPKPGAADNFFHADLSLTFGWAAKNEKRRWLSPLALFYGSFSERKTVWGAVPLLMGYRRVGEQFNFGQFPLVWWWGNRHVKNFLVLPFHYQQKAPEGFTGATALLFWYGHKHLADTDPLNDRRHFVAAPVFWQFRRGLKRWDVAPIYFGGANDGKGLRHATLLPFFHWQSREFGNRRELWTLPFVRRVDDARGRRAWALPPLLTFRHEDPDRRLLSVTPLFWRAHDRIQDGYTTVLGPFGMYQDPRQRNAIFFPLFWQFRDRRAQVTTTAFVPLAVARTSPERRSVWTLVGGGMRGRDGSWGFGVPPLLSFGQRHPDGRSVAGVLGLFWHVHDPNANDGAGARDVVLGPLAWSSRRGQNRSVGLPPLLSFVGRQDDKSYQVITPLFWHVKNGHPARPRDTWVVLPLYVHRHRGGFDGGLVPLAFFGSGREHARYAVLPFLLTGFRHDPEAKKSLLVSPLAVFSKDTDHRTLGILGLGWDVKRPGERHTVAFPLYYRRQTGDRVLHLTPVGGGLRTKDGFTWVAGPIYNTSSAKAGAFGVIPLAFHHWRALEGGGSTATTVVPPFYLARREPGDRLDVVTPLIWRRVVEGERARKGLAVVPFYFRQRQPKGVDVDAGLGFFYSRDPRRHTHTLVAGTFFHRLSRKRLNTGIAPLYWWMDSQEKRRLLALPAIFHFRDKDEGSHTTIAVPLWFDRQRANGRRGWAAFPFVFGNRRLHNFTRFSLAPPGYVDFFRIGKNHRFVGFAPLLFRYEKCGFQRDDDPRCRYRIWGSFPLFLAGRDGMGRRTHAGLLLWYWDRTPKGFKLFTPAFGVNYSPGEKLGWYVPPLAVKTTRTHRRVLLFPLFYRKAHRLADESTTIVAPPLFIGQHKKDRRWFEAALLVWQFRQQHKVSTAVLPPIFFHSHSYAERKLTWLLPVFLRDDHRGKDQAWTALFPAAYVQRRKGEDLDIVQFPLVWHIERGENQGTFGAFLWWDIRARGNTFQMVPGVYTRFAGRRGDTKVIGPGLGWWTKGRGEDEGDRHWRALFGLFGGGVEDGRRYASIFGVRIDRGPRAGASATRSAATKAQRKRARRPRVRQR